MPREMLKTPPEMRTPPLISTHGAVPRVSGIDWGEGGFNVYTVLSDLVCTYHNVYLLHVHVHVHVCVSNFDVVLNHNSALYMYVAIIM